MERKNAETGMRQKEISGLGCFLVGAVLLMGVNLYEKGTDKIPVFSEESVELSEKSDRAAEDTKDIEVSPMVALTFDDGPHPVYTKQLLEGLKKRGVKATFFVVGENIPGQEELIRKMQQEGHLIGNHTYDHCNLSCLSVEAAQEELAKTSRLIQDITGNATSYIRPPYGKWKDDLDNQISMISVNWTLDTRDWDTRNTSDIVKKVMTDVRENDIILLHDYYQTSVEAALQIVDQLTEKGYRFVTVEELLLE